MFQTSARYLFGAALAASLSASLIACTPNPNGPVGPDGKTPSPSPSSSIGVDANLSLSLPNPLDIASVSGLTAKSCSEESGLKSGSGAATNVNFKNSSTGKINIYWLDHNGKRVSYKQGLAAGASHQQSTFVTHPWVITNDQDQCMGIYTPSQSGSVTLDVKKTVTVSGSASGNTSGNTSTGGSTTITAASGTEARVRQGIDCLKATGKIAQAGAVQGSLNLYLEAQKQGGMATILGNAHLIQAEQISKENGC